MTESPDATETRTADRRGARLAFAVALILGLIIILWFGRHTWFRGDEWNVLATRSLTDAGDLFRPINRVHWITLPVIQYKAVYGVFGLHSYLPYQLPVVILHLTAALLMRRLMIRTMVEPWIATCAAAAFVFFGSGRPNLVWGFQVTLVGSLVLGLTHLLLATHEGPADRRDVWGLLAGLAGLLCSGLAPTMTVVVGVSVLLLHGWRRALLHTVPLGLVYLIWWFGYASSAEATDFDRGTPGDWAEFVWIGLREAFSSLGQNPIAAIALVATLGIGLTLAWVPLSQGERRRRAAIPVAMLLGAVLFLVVTAVGRVAAGLGEGGLVVLGVDAASSPRFQHIVAALLLLPLAVAATAIARHWPLLLAPLCVLFLVGIPGNIEALANPTQITFREGVHRADRDFARAAPRVPIAERVPADVRAHPRSMYLTLGWLRGSAAEGRLPDIDPIPDQLASNASAQLALVSSPVVPDQCRAAPVDEVVVLQRDQAIVFDGPPNAVMMVVYIDDNGVTSGPRRFIELVTPAVRATTGPISVRIEPNDAIESISVCE